MTSPTIKWAGAILAGGFILSFLGLYNGYPSFTPIPERIFFPDFRAKFQWTGL
ncbi:MAG: hypothetical protein IPM36_14430 [Lewinellaceae bacterium]|nr:hypothetical protein [Lewinellaceae bacterium]